MSADLEKIKKVLGNTKQFIHGDTALCYGALLAGCDFYGGYPITPASEVFEMMSQLMPKLGGVCIQMEDEIASIASIIGASWTGAKAFTATSGPGYSLMQENIGYACMTETPIVIANVQRSGPSTGQPTLGAQGDMMQARYGSHGDFETIALSPNTIQETMEFTIKAFNLSEEYRTPVSVMINGDIGHMREMITIPDKVELFQRKKPKVKPSEYVPFGKGLYGKEKVPEFAVFGTGYHTYVTGLTHNEAGFPATDDQKEHDLLVRRLCEKITDDREKLTDVEEREMEDADTALVSYGMSSRSALGALNMAKKEGKKLGYFRLKTIWPFPEKSIEELSKKVDKIIVVEMNLGQIYHKVKEFADCEVVLSSKIGGEPHSPKDILKEVY